MLSAPRKLTTFGVIFYRTSLAFPVFAEFLNDIRWAIFEHLQPEYLRSWHRPDDTDELLYSYRVPQDCTEPVAWAMYSNLMNRVRAKPWMQRFTVDAALMSRY